MHRGGLLQLGRGGLGQPEGGVDGPDRVRVIGGPVALRQPHASQAHRRGDQAAAGFEPRVAFETHSPASVCELVAAGLGIALLAGSSARAAGQAIDVYPLRPAPARTPIGLVRLRGRPLDPAARAWAEHLVVACGRAPSGGLAPGPAGIQ